MNRNKHNNRVSPQPPKNIHRNTPLSQVPGLASTFGNEKGSIVALGQLLWAQGGGGTWCFWIFTDRLLFNGYGPRYRKVKFAQVEDSPEDPLVLTGLHVRS